MRKIYIFVLFLIAIATIPMALYTLRGQQDYVVLMLVCGGRYDSNDLHVGRFDSEASAKAWADSEMTGHWDIAYIYDMFPNDGTQRLLWARSESSCYPDMGSWRRIE